MGLSGLFERVFLKKIDGKNAHDWFELGAKERDPAKKVEYFENVVKLKPGFVGAWNLLGSAHADLGEFEKALECYDQALSICPSYKEARLNRKNLEKKMKEAEAVPETGAGE
ncbi:tetratricopeptide repeat protein [Methanosarcina sp. KYL-1]|uniref:tetratricopeptide repeat protein n=1 Tax=Methanosarcina sp. KYL-1 TaxID=2602068 RepID=UPI002100A9BB|nr:tetratricopeptide repeat protein [Methanosarcina sp. KYL-1]MCQ1534466.1 tetratricopeptide repeat protein [Methanosarcina sp. KYL-1]